MKRLLITAQLPQVVETAAAARFDVTLRHDPLPLTAPEATAALARYDAILPTLGDDFSRAVFANPPHRCRLLANFGAGMNHIDTDAARMAGIALTNTPGAVTEPTADIAMMLILMVARKASQGEALARSGAWRGWRPMQMLGMDLAGKRLAIIGMGRIGKAVARRAHLGFGMQIAFFNRSPVADPGVPAMQIATLPALLAQSDVILLALPATAQTRHIIDGAALNAMQPHAILINIGRGNAVDEAALIEALEQNRIGGAGLDVYEHEPEIPARLRALANVTLLPHLGTSTYEAREAMGFMALENLLAWDEGRELPNPYFG